MRGYGIWLAAAMVVNACLGGALAAAEASGAHAFSFTSIEGAPLPLESFAGHPILVVNTASMCGFTYQYSALQRVWDAYRDAASSSWEFRRTISAARSPAPPRRSRNFAR